MGCGSSLHDNSEDKTSPVQESTIVVQNVVPKNSTKDTDADRKLRAVLLIQRFARRYMANLEAKRTITWKVYEELEMLSEQEHFNMSNFFDTLLDNLDVFKKEFQDKTEQERREMEEKGLRELGGKITSTDNKFLQSLRKAAASSAPEEDSDDFLETIDPNMIRVSGRYNGVRFEDGMNESGLVALLDQCTMNKKLHKKYVLVILKAVKAHFASLPNIVSAQTSIHSGKITVIGDLHGQMGDLLMIFQKNGVPSADNPYVFNGDFVDRGPNSVGCALIIFMCVLVYPNAVYVNRGNHEESTMGMRYGFVKEIIARYCAAADAIVKGFQSVFRSLPLMTIIDQRVAVVHGGISNETTIERLQAIPRQDYLSILKPSHNLTDNRMLEWKILLDILWSDPHSKKGCEPNKLRGGGVFFGPDITSKFLKTNKFDYIIRSHECKPDGYSVCHEDKVITIFSASNYYSADSNKGAFIVLEKHKNYKPQFTQFNSLNLKEKKSFRERTVNIELHAVEEIKCVIAEHSDALISAFTALDVNGSGFITTSQWTDVLNSIIPMRMSWLSLRHLIVESDNNLIKWASCVDKSSVKVKNKLTISSLYKNRVKLETIFRIMDTDNSGEIAIDEFRKGCALLNLHLPVPIPDADIDTLAMNMDINGDGVINFNEFIEAFRLSSQVTDNSSISERQIPSDDESNQE